jgi:septum formation protein
VLASASPTRAGLLRAAGLDALVDAASIDEGRLKAGLRAQACDGGSLAAALAAAKALSVCARHLGSRVVGADQVLDLEGSWLDKPDDRDQAAAQLRRLRGRTHRLSSAVCVARDGAVIWRHVDFARLTMRAFSDRFLDD